MSVKPCPFCVDSVVEVMKWEGDKSPGFWYVHCDGCMESHGAGRTAEDAIEDWNRRPIEDALTAELSAMTAQRDALAEAIEQVECVENGEDEYGCPWCFGEGGDGPDGKMVVTHAADCKRQAALRAAKGE